MKFLVPIDLVQNELQNAVIQNLAAPPANGKAGQLYFNTTDKLLYQHNGTEWKPVGGIYELPIASSTTLGGIKVGGGLQISAEGTLSTTGGGVADSVEWSGVLDTPTTLAGYGIVDAKIENGVITLGKNTITPVTSVDGQSGAVTTNAVKYTAQTLTNEQKTQARVNIGAGTSDFSGSFNDLTDKPTVDTEMSATSTNAVQNKVIKAYVDAIISASQGIVYKGTINSVDDIPTTYDVGWLYMIATAGTYVGQKCEVGDLMIAVVARKGTGNQNSDWDIVQTNIDGAITELTGDSPISVTGTGASREIALENSGVTTGGYGDSTAQTPAFGAKFKVPSFTVDQYGRLTVAGEHEVTIPSTVATDSVSGLMSAEDHEKFTASLTDIATLKTKAITKVSGNIAVGATSVAIQIGDKEVLSIVATNATTGEEVVVDSIIKDSKVTASLAKAVTYVVKIVVTTL
nr:MAG TPA: hypothetical protein [Caudoviricetes sp.]